MKKEGFFILLLILALLPFASAEIFISQPASLYNIGEAFIFNITLMPDVSTNDFFVAKIVCAEGESEIYRIPQSVASGAQKNIEISGKFDNFLIGGLEGNCHLNTKYGTSGVNSKDFEISRYIIVTLGTDKVILNPGERFTVSGTAVRRSGTSAISGFIELRLSELNITSFRAIEDGKFNQLFDIADNTPAGDYDFSARVYEKDSEGKITNEGEGATRIRINQVIKKNSIAINSQNVDPGSVFIYTIILLDQSNKEALQDVKVSIYKPSGTLISEKMVKSSAANNLTIGKSFPPGNWKIKSEINNLVAERDFYVKELEEAAYELANKTLIAANTGNVPYKKSVEVSIGDESVIQEVDLGIGEIRRYALFAPDGQYEVKINEEGSTKSLGTSFLTGNAIKVSDEDDGGFWRRYSLLIWIMLISLAILIAFNLYGRISKKPYFGKTPTSTSVYAAPIKVSESKVVAKDGSREECSIIALKIKNHEQLESAKGSAIDAIERILTRGRDARAKIFSDKNYKTLVFAPSITREKDNSMKAVAIAKEIESILIEHNKRFKEKISFSVGVHNGEMILENLNGELKFNPIGNTMPFAKKVADSISAGVAVSEFVHRKILGKVKSDRIEGTNYWRIAKVRDRELHSDFISKFMNRQKSDMKK